MALLVIAGGASYLIGQSNAGVTTSTTTSTFTKTAIPVTQTVSAPKFQTITSSVIQTITQSTTTQTVTQTSTQTSTLTSTSTAYPISFSFIPQPKTGMASNFTKLFGVSLPSTAKVRFLNFTTTDGVTLNGGLVEPQDHKPAYAILAVHGRGNNYSFMMNRFALKFEAHGYAVLAIDMRGHDGNAFKDNFDDYVKDIGAGITILKSLGYSNVLLLGQSLGVVQVIAYAGTVRDPVVKAVLVTGPTANLAAKSQYGCAVVYKDPTLYGKIYSDAKDLMSQGKPYAILPETVPYGWIPGRFNMSAISFLTNYSPEAIPTTSYIRHVPVPVILVRVSSDTTVPDYEAKWNVNNATAPGSQVPIVNYTVVADPSGKAGHGIAVVAVQQAVVDTIAAWLQGLKMEP